MSLPEWTSSFFLLHFDGKDEFLASFHHKPWWNGNIVNEITQISWGWWYGIIATALSFIHKKEAQVYPYFLSFIAWRVKVTYTNKWLLQKKTQHNTLSQVMLCGRLDEMELAMFSTSTAHSMILLKNYTAS